MQTTDSMAAVFNTIEEIKELPSDVPCCLAAVISNKQEITTKSTKKKMCFLKLEDLSGDIEAVMFPSSFDKFHQYTNDIVPLKIEGKISKTETDEGKVTKIILYSAQPLEINIDVRPSNFEIKSSLSKSKELTKLFEKCTGHMHGVSIILESEDGTRFKMPSIKIGNYKGVFLRELARINSEQETI